MRTLLENITKVGATVERAPVLALLEPYNWQFTIIELKFNGQGALWALCRGLIGLPQNLRLWLPPPLC